jgi:hypothetical protein
MNELKPPPFRILGPPEPAPVRRRGPGVAVLVIAAYALAFFAALWFLRAHSPLFRRPAAAPARSAAPALPSRASLLEGEGLPPLAREEYLARLATDFCDCGCDMTLHVCLVSDRTCTRSQEMANAVRLASTP